MIDNTAALSHRGVKNRAVWKGENDWEKSPLTRPDILGKQNESSPVLSGPLPINGIGTW
jgi:hypothetical protein